MAKLKATSRIGEWIAVRRDYVGLTQSDIASKTGMHASTVSKLENGNSTPGIRTMRKLAEVLKTDMETLKSVKDGKWIDPARSPIVSPSLVPAHDDVIAGVPPVWLPPDLWDEVKRIASDFGEDPRDLIAPLVRKGLKLAKPWLGVVPSVQQHQLAQKCHDQPK